MLITVVLMTVTGALQQTLPSLCVSRRSRS